MAAVKTESREGMSHTLTIEDRKRLSLTGVTDVHKCDESCVTVETAMGLLIVRGSGISMEKLDLEAGRMMVSGSFDGLEYKAGKKRTKTTLGDIFR